MTKAVVIRVLVVEDWRDREPEGDAMTAEERATQGEIDLKARCGS